MRRDDLVKKLRDDKKKAARWDMSGKPTSEQLTEILRQPYKDTDWGLGDDVYHEYVGQHYGKSHPLAQSLRNMGYGIADLGWRGLQGLGATYESMSRGLVGDTNMSGAEKRRTLRDLEALEMATGVATASPATVARRITRNSGLADDLRDETIPANEMSVRGYRGLPDGADEFTLPPSNNVRAFGDGFYFSPDRSRAEGFGNVTERDLSFNNPLIIDEMSDQHEVIARLRATEGGGAVRDYVQKRGGDGIVFRNKVGDDVEFVAYDPKKIKTLPKTETKEFKEWFRGSKAVDEKGSPSVFYHGTKTDFDTFKGDIMFFTEDKGVANIYSGDGRDIGGQVLPVFLRTERPFDTRNPTHRKIFNDEFLGKWGNGAPLSEKGLPDWTDAEDFKEFFKDKGYDFDSVYIQEPQGSKSVAVFDPNQIKSVYNKGDFSRKSENIMKAVAPIGIAGALRDKDQ